MAEKYRKYVYCDIDFLKEFICPEEEESYVIDNVRTANLMLAVRSLLLNPYIVLFLNITDRQFNDIIKSIDKKRIKAAKKGEEAFLTQFEKFMLDINITADENKLQLKYLPENNSIDEILQQALKEPAWYDATFLLPNSTSDEEIHKLKNYGILAICKENWKKCQQLVCDNGCAIKKGTKGEWQDFIKTRDIPCNSLTIIDNYILNDIKNFDANIRPILSCLLPQKLEGDLVFEISIITTLPPKNNCPIDPSIRYEKIKEILLDIRPELRYSITIFKCEKGSFHDRCIITNNLMITCGAGFDLLNDKYTVQKHTTLSILHPYLSIYSPWAPNAVSILIGALKESEPKYKFGENGVNSSFPQYSIGPTNLRILMD